MSLLPQPNGILQVITVPIQVDRPSHEIFGTLSLGFLLDNALAEQLKKITGSDVAFGMDGQILASTLPAEANAALAGRLRATGISRVFLDAEEYESLRGRWPRATATRAWSPAQSRSSFDRGPCSCSHFNRYTPVSR